MKRKTQLKNIAILIPAHNEAVVLSQTLKAARKLVSKNDLYIVDDGSTDQTLKIAKRFTRNVLVLKPKQGKAAALNSAVVFFRLTDNYQFIFPIDADTKVSPDFLKESLKILNEDKEEKYICVIGKVLGEYNNWLTSYRMWEYEIAQLVHKKAQEKEQAILVCPGCATIYRSKLFKKVKIPTDTVTEDMDLTFLIHRQRLGKIAFTAGATVVTQDPFTLRDYIKQIRRWYQGYWQCFKKYNLPWGRQALDFEAMIVTIEGLAGGLLVCLLLISFPFLLLKRSTFLLIPFVLDFLLFFFPTIFITLFIHCNLKILKYFPTFYLIRALNSLLFLYSFIESLFQHKKYNYWGQSHRYKIKGGTCIVRFQ